MSESNFGYLAAEFPILNHLGQSSEYHLYDDPIPSLFKLRQLVERLMEVLFREHGARFIHENILDKISRLVKRQSLTLT